MDTGFAKRGFTVMLMGAKVARDFSQPGVKRNLGLGGYLSADAAGVDAWLKFLVARRLWPWPGRAP